MVWFLGKRTTGQGPFWNVGPLRTRHAVAGQEAPPGNEDQEEDAEPTLERNVLL